MGKDEIRRRLTKIVDKTKGAEKLAAGGWWDGDGADKRRTLDDLKAGRIAWATARRHANSGLAALDQGDEDAASLYLWSANDLYIDAIEAQLIRIRPSERSLHRPALRRGRPRKAYQKI